MHLPAIAAALLLALNWVLAASLSSVAAPGSSDSAETVAEQMVEVVEAAPAPSSGLSQGSGDEKAATQVYEGDPRQHLPTGSPGPGGAPPAGEVVGVEAGRIDDVPASVGSSGYSDLAEAGVHADAVAALDSIAVFADTECAPGRFCPNEPVERWVMAVWLGRLAYGLTSPGADSSTFSDVGSDDWWGGYVEELVGSGVTRGCATQPARFCPDRPVTRAQMASFLTRAFGFQPAGPAGFIDTAESSHRADIDALAAAEITRGCSLEPLRYCPSRAVTRAEMASFLARTVGLVPIVGSTPGPGGEAPAGEVDGSALERFLGLDLVSRYTTHHDCCNARAHNIQLMADLVDGVVVPPGQRFSINRHVGKRTLEKGFQEAGSLLFGNIVETPGGGVSQFVTTLFNAALWGGYQIVFHQPHSSYFDRYPMGNEATVSWPDIDLIIRNDSPAEMIILADYTPTSITVHLFGDNDGRAVAGDWMDGGERVEVLAPGGAQARMVTVEVSEPIDPVEPPGTLLRPNSDLEQDERNTVQSAANGWTMWVSRAISQAGDVTTRRWWVDYRPRQEIVEVHPCVIEDNCDPES